MIPSINRHRRVRWISGHAYKLWVAVAVQRERPHAGDIDSSAPVLGWCRVYLKLYTVTLNRVCRILPVCFEAVVSKGPKFECCRLIAFGLNLLVLFAL